MRGLSDFDKYNEYIPIFREAWLNRDFSEDFYRQRRKQVFVYVVLQQLAEVVTEGVYNTEPGDDKSEDDFATQPKCRPREPRKIGFGSQDGRPFRRAQAAIGPGYLMRYRLEDYAEGYSVARYLNLKLLRCPECTKNNYSDHYLRYLEPCEWCGYQIDWEAAKQLPADCDAVNERSIADGWRRMRREQTESCVCNRYKQREQSKDHTLLPERA